MIYNDINELIGKTPLVKYNDNILLKLESFNPSGSIKDRASYQMIKKAFERGDINKDTIVIEPTSGNTGISLAMVCAVLGLKLIICMPENMSKERQNFISAYGAQIILTKADKGMDGAVKEAEKLHKKYSNSWIPMQFSNIDNLDAHEQTAKEIVEDSDNKFDIIVAGIGTGGTAFGLKKYLPNKLIYGVEPDESPLFTRGKSGKHKIQGIGANFIPDLCKDINLDGIVTVSGDDSIEEARNLAKEKGIFCGITSGANLAAAKELSKKYHDKTIVVMIPDSGDRYLFLWETNHRGI